MCEKHLKNKVHSAISEKENMHKFKIKYHLSVKVQPKTQQTKINYIKASTSSVFAMTPYVLTMRAAAQWCQSGQQENSLPGPLLGQPQHHHPASTGPSRPPASSKSLRCCHNERARAKRPRCESVFYILQWEESSPLCYKCVSVSDCHSASLRSQELPTAHSRPAASSSTPHRQPGRHRHREGRGGEREGGRRVLLSCSLTVLFVQPFLWPVHYRGNSWVHIWTHVQPLSLLKRYRFSHQREEQYRGGQTRVWTMIVSWPRLNEVWKASGEKALWLTATGTQARSMPTGPQKLQSDPRHVNSQKDMYICVGKTTWYRILQRRAANCLMHRSEKPELNWNLWLDWTGQRGLPTWLSSTVPNLSFMHAQLSCAQENCRVATALSATHTICSPQLQRCPD